MRLDDNYDGGRDGHISENQRRLSERWRLTSESKIGPRMTKRGGSTVSILHNIRDMGALIDDAVNIGGFLAF